jgi:hypothetical protein
MHPSVVDKNIEATEDLDGSQNSFFRCSGVSHVGPNAHCLSPAGTNPFYAFTRVQEIGNHHAHARGSQCCSNAAANASRASGYKGHIKDFGFRHESSSSTPAPKNWLARSIVTWVLASYNSRSPNSHCLFGQALLWNVRSDFAAVPNVFFLERLKFGKNLLTQKSVVKAF